MTLNDKKTKNCEDAQQIISPLHRKIEKTGNDPHKIIPDESEKTLALDSLRLLESQQAAMEELAGNIAHQWRQPLNIVGLTVQKLQFDFEKNEVDCGYVHELVSEVLELLKQMSRTVQNFRNFMQSENSRQQFNMNESIAQVLSFVDGSMKSAGIEIIMHSPDEEIMVNNFRYELIRIVLGILNKSKKALVQNKPDNPHIELKLSRNKNSCALTIRDNGGQLPKQDLAMIFEPGSGSGARGTGMELHMAKLVLEHKMSGKLKVRNRNGGVEFRIEL